MRALGLAAVSKGILHTSYLHEHFVFCPIDKATNVAIICKHFYLNNIINERKTNVGITVGNDQHVILIEINDNIHNFINILVIKLTLR